MFNKKKRLSPRGVKAKKTKRNLRLRIITSLGMALLFGISLIFQAGDGRSPSYKPTSSTVSPSPTSSPSQPAMATPEHAEPHDEEQYNAVDSMAILGTFALAGQVPENPGTTLNKFIVELETAKNNPNKSTLDLGVMGNQLIDYSLTTAGFSSPVCFAIKAPIVEGQTPKQSVWVIYFDPATKQQLPLIAITLGVTSCSQGKLAASQVENNKRTNVSSISRSVLQEAILRVPSTFLTKIGLLMLDEARGLTATQSPTPIKKP